MTTPEPAVAHPHSAQTDAVPPTAQAPSYPLVAPSYQTPRTPYFLLDTAELDLPPRRARVLDTVRAASHALQPQEIADHLDLHLNTVRMHLAALEKAELITRVSIPHAGRGRPAIAYQVPPANTLTPRLRYSVTLANLLLEHLDATSPNPRGEATLMGVQLGHQLAEGFTNDSSPFDQALRLTYDWGFDPAWRSQSHTLLLRHCPFRELKYKRLDLICCVHAGTMQGIMEGCGIDTKDCQMVVGSETVPCEQRLPNATIATPHKVASPHDENSVTPGGWRIPLAMEATGADVGEMVAAGQSGDSVGTGE